MIIAIPSFIVGLLVGAVLAALIVKDGPAAQPEFAVTESAVTVVEMSYPSGCFWPAAFWRCCVIYDAKGAPYARRLPDPSLTVLVRLKPDGRTDDVTRETTWVHVSGPEVKFQGAHA